MGGIKKSVAKVFKERPGILGGLLWTDVSCEAQSMATRVTASSNAVCWVFQPFRTALIASLVVFMSLIEVRGYKWKVTEWSETTITFAGSKIEVLGKSTKTQGKLIFHLREIF